MKTKQLRTEFVHRIPHKLENGVLYVCLECNAVLHKCACGCGEEISTPIGNGGWTFFYDGEGVTLSPSIGNWSYPCRSHYFIRGSQVIWAKSLDNKGKKRKKKWWQFWE